MDRRHRDGALFCLAGALAALLLHPADSAMTLLQLKARIPEGFATGAPLDLDRSAVRELRRLPRIGQKRALDIVRSRWEHGPLGGVDALERIQGIGPQTIEDLRPVLAPD